MEKQIDIDHMIAELRQLRSQYQGQEQSLGKEYQNRFEQIVKELSEQLFTSDLFRNNGYKEVDGLRFFTALQRSLDQFVRNEHLSDFPSYLLRVYKNDCQREKSEEAFASQNGTGRGYQSTAKRYNQMYKKIVQICNAIGQDVHKMPQAYIEMVAEQLDCKADTVKDCLEKMQSIRLDISARADDGSEYEVQIPDRNANRYFDEIEQELDGIEKQDRYEVVFSVMADTFACAKVKVRQRLMTAFTNELMIHLRGIESRDLKQNKVLHLKESSIRDYQEKVTSYLSHYEHLLFSRLVDSEYTVYTLIQDSDIDIHTVHFLTYGILREGRNFNSTNIAQYWQIGNSSVTDFMNHHYRVVKDRVIEEVYDRMHSAE